MAEPAGERCRPPAVELEQPADTELPAEPEVPAEACALPQEDTPTSASASASLAGVISIGDINEFQMYQRFRLKMVKTFGSLTSALFEFGADPNTGEISRSNFEEVCSNRLGILSPTEARVLFSHVTNADPLEAVADSTATHRHFGISDEEWQLVAAAKQRERDGTARTTPFASGPAGSSLGMFHRPIHVASVGEHTSPRAASASGDVSLQDAVETPGSAKQGATSSTLRSSLQGDRASRRQRRTGEAFPWRQPQRPWSRSLFAGEGLLRETQDFWPRARPREQRPFCTAGKASLLLEQPKHQQLGTPRRAPPHDQGFLVPACPVRRSEMEPRICARQVDAWWAFGRPRPATKLQAVLRG
mmetsp:Transcript_117625/g.365617  ORF Transcript_117625/g.365617 Transcript_117625/m.365617 type:complete len:360 (+) Transcript_117625:402-1481(+)